MVHSSPITSADQVVDFLHKVVLLFLLFSPARSPWLADGLFKVIKFREDLSKVLDNVHVNTSTGRLLTRERVSVGETHVLLVPVGKSTLVLAFGRFFHVKDFDCSIYVERDLILSSPEELVSPLPAPPPCGNRRLQDPQCIWRSHA